MLEFFGFSIQNRNPIDHMEESKRLLKSTWIRIFLRKRYTKQQWKEELIHIKKQEKNEIL